MHLIAIFVRSELRWLTSPRKATWPGTEVVAYHYWACIYKQDARCRADRRVPQHRLQHFIIESRCDLAIKRFQSAEGDLVTIELVKHVHVLDTTTLSFKLR